MTDLTVSCFRNYAIKMSQQIFRGYVRRMLPVCDNTNYCVKYQTVLLQKIITRSTASFLSITKVQYLQYSMHVKNQKIWHDRNDY